jgi:putative tryptophan/tyrosine transport system substrate-binding protein
MRRREFIAGLAAGAIRPLSARAQQQALPVIGFLHGGRVSDQAAYLPGFRQGLREGGLVERENVNIAYRWAENQPDRLPALATELARQGAAVIVASPNPPVIAAARAATTTTPIVFISGPDPVSAGLVASLNKPGGNLTGMTLISNGLDTKRLGLMRDLVPQATVVAMLLDTRSVSFRFDEMESAGRKVGLQIIGLRVSSEGDFDAALATAVRERAGALVVAGSVFLFNYRDRLVARVAEYRLPAIYQEHEYALAGGMMSYGPSLSDSYRQAGLYAGRVLKGEKPASLPVQQPTKFELVINLKTAKALGLTIPETLLATADEVIQ